MTVDRDGHVHLGIHSNNDDEADRLYHELKKVLNHIGMADHHVLGKNFYMKMNIPVAGCAHQAGTCRFGTIGDVGARPELQGHELDNLYVVDTSFFPSIGAVNPALTAIMARSGRRAPRRTPWLTPPETRPHSERRTS